MEPSRAARSVTVDPPPRLASRSQSNGAAVSTSHGISRTQMPRRLLIVAWGLYTATRLPAFFEPHWYTDEAGYAATANAMLHGKLLYVGVWNNKPPLHLWTVAAVLKLFGPSEAAFHSLTYLAGLAALGAAAYAAYHLLPARRAALATVAVALGLGTPVFDAELVVPESLLIAATSWAGALLLVRLYTRTPGWRWAAVVGLLAAAATAYQQTALADACAFLVILVLSPSARRRQLWAYVAAFVLGSAAWLVPALAVAGPSRLAYALAGFYVPYTQSMLPRNVAQLGLLVAVGLLAVALALASSLILRRSTASWGLAIWSVATLLAAAAPQHSYPHLLLPAAVPTLLLAFAIPLTARTFPRFQLAGLLGLLLAVATAFNLARVTTVDWIPQLGSGRSLGQYYGGFLTGITGPSSLAQWQSSFDYRVAPDAAVVGWLTANGRTHSRAVVWSADAWVYVLGDLEQVLPTPPIYNDFALLGYHGQVAVAVAQQQPALILTTDIDAHQFPEVQALLDRDYSEVFSSGPEHIWVRRSAPPTA